MERVHAQRQDVTQTKKLFQQQQRRFLIKAALFFIKKSPEATVRLAYKINPLFLAR